MEYMKEKGTIKTENMEINIVFIHNPSIGERSPYNGKALWLGDTTANTKVGNISYTAHAKCWIGEPFSYSRGRYISTGRILKEIGLDTKLAKQVRCIYPGK